MTDPSSTRLPRSPRRLSRAQLLRGTAGGLALLGVGGALTAATARGGAVRLTPRDRAVFDFALLFEEVQVAFYAQALATGRLSGEARQFAEVVGAEERAHLRYVRAALGSGPATPSTRPRPVRGDRAFIAAAVDLEEIGLAAYNGQAGNLSRSALASVSRVISVEARHAAWARSLAGELPAPAPTDTPIAATVAMTRLRPLLVG